MSKHVVGCASAVLAVLGSASCSKFRGVTSSVTVEPAKMSRIGTVDQRFQSYNVEMLEVTGGRFWKPYKDIGTTSKKQAPNEQADSNPAGMDPNLYEYRRRSILRTRDCARWPQPWGLAYVRVSGTWANTTYFHNSDKPAPKTPPKGFNGVLTRQQWKGVIDFAHAVDADLVTSFATSPGTRDAAGVWTPVQARQILAFTKSAGGNIAAAEYMNEPTYAEMGGAPKGYGAAAFARDFAVFRPFVKQVVPDMVILGPGGVGEGLWGRNRAQHLKRPFRRISFPAWTALKNSMRASATNSSQVSRSGSRKQRTQRAAAIPGPRLFSIASAISINSGECPNGASRCTPIILLRQSDYGLLDENTFMLRPNYWAALLWRKFMGTTVFDPGPSPSPGLHFYAHSLRGVPGGVALLVINTDRTKPMTMGLATAAEQYALTARDISSAQVEMNGSELKLGAGDAIPQFTGAPVGPGRLTFAPGQHYVPCNSEGD